MFPYFQFYTVLTLLSFPCAGGTQGTDTGGMETWRLMESRVTTAERKTMTASLQETGTLTDRQVAVMESK